MNPNQWTQQKYFAALDWARDHHDVVVVDQAGTVVCELRFEHTRPTGRTARNHVL